MAAAAAAPPTTGAQPFAKGSIIWQKRGPLPVWAWALIVLLLVLVFTWWRRNKDTAEQESAYTSMYTTGFSGGTLPGQQTPPYIWVVPPATPPAVNVPVEVNVPPQTTPTAPPAGGGTPPTTPPPTTPPPVNQGDYVSVAKWPDNSAPRESTLWDIAGSWLPEGAAQWGIIWNHPLNADIRGRRGAPDRIQQGDQIWVPGKLSSPRSSY